MLGYNEEAAKVTAQRLNIYTDDIQQAIKIVSEYSRDLNRMKSIHREESKRKLAEDTLRANKEAHPDLCFCEDEDFKVERKYEEDGILGEFETMSYPFYNPAATHIENYYKCSRCGKKYTEYITYA